jgi:hypothetical protein
MVAKCANPSCSVPFLRMGHGKLFRYVPKRSSVDLFDPGPGRTIFFWLCDKCSSTATLKFDSTGAATLEAVQEPSTTYMSFTYL